jgi:hypothetical protein
MQVKDELAGKKIRCPDCKQVLPVPHGPERDVEDEASKILAEDSPEEKSVPAAEEKKSSAIQERRPPSLAPQIPRSPLSSATSSMPTKAKTRPKKSRSERGGGIGIAIHPSIIAGALMMIGAAVWFFLGLAAGIFYFYPPVLFCFGIAAIIRGLMGQD